MLEGLLGPDDLYLDFPEIGAFKQRVNPAFVYSSVQLASLQVFNVPLLREYVLKRPPSRV